MEVLRRRAKEKGATLVELPDDKVDEWGGVEDAKLQGSFQKYNMALAVAAAREHLAQLGHAFEGPFAGDDYRLEDMPIEFKEGLKVATLRGRCEVILDKEGVEWYLDGAHTDDSLYAVAQWFASKTPAEDTAVRVLIFNQQERDSSALLSTLLQAGAKSRQSEEGDRKLYDCVILCRNEIEEPEAGEPRRDLTVQEKNLAVVKDWEMLIHEKTSFDHGVFPAVRPAVKMARQYRGEEGKRCKVLVTGSFHLVGAVIKCIEHVEC
jgi:folylpolyglutamate synthase